MSNYAIIAESGRQIIVREGQEIEIDYQGLSKGDDVTFDRVLAIREEDGLKIGAPQLEGAVVKATAIGVSQGPKLTIQKFRRRKNSRRKTGHRQLYNKVRIEKITL